MRTIKPGKPAIFLDLDGVLVDKEFGESFAILCMDLLRKKLLGFHDVIWIWIRSRLWRRGLGVNSSMEAIAKRVARRLKGQEYSKMLEAEIGSAKHLRMAHGAVEFLPWLKEHFDVYIITGTSQGMADYFGRLFGVKAFGTRLEVSNGVFTGKVELVMNQNNKAATVELIAKKHGIDLKSSFALGDQIEDSKMLSLVGNPICVRPGGGLRRFNAGRWTTAHSLAEAMAHVREKVGGKK